MRLFDLLFFRRFVHASEVRRRTESTWHQEAGGHLLNVKVPRGPVAFLEAGQAPAARHRPPHAVALLSAPAGEEECVGVRGDAEL